MMHMSKCTKAGVKALLYSVAILVTLVGFSRLVHASNFMCQYPSIPPEGTGSVIEQPEDLKEQTRHASATILEGLSSFILAMSARERMPNDLEEYMELSEAAAQTLSDAAEVLVSIDLSGKPSDLEFVTSLPSTEFLVGVDDTREQVRAIVRGIGGEDFDSLTHTSDLNSVAASATAALAAEIEMGIEYTSDDPRFARLRQRFSDYVWLGDLLSRIGDATYFRPLQ